MKNSNYELIEEKVIQNKEKRWLNKYKCKSCGTIIIMRHDRAEKSKKCVHNTRHINHNKLLGKVYYSMISRCYNSSDKSYRWYGKKGIRICDEWLMSFTDFEKWSLENGYKEGLSIDRINENKDYCPENCRWVTLEENSRFKSTTNIICVNNITKSGKQWSKELNKGVNFINRMIRKKGLNYTVDYIQEHL